MAVLEDLPEEGLEVVDVLLCENVVRIFYALHLSSLRMSFGVYTVGSSPIPIYMDGVLRI